MSSRTNPKVAVLMGGISAEREVSLSSGRECAAALRSEGFEVIEVDCGRDLAMRLSEISPDVCFNALHGPLGEDGAVQGLLEWMGNRELNSAMVINMVSVGTPRQSKPREMTDA